MNEWHVFTMHILNYIIHSMTINIKYVNTDNSQPPVKLMVYFKKSTVIYYPAAVECTSESITITNNNLV